MCIAIAPPGAIMAEFESIADLEEHVDNSDDAIEDEPLWAIGALGQEHRRLKEELVWDGNEFRVTEQVRKRNHEDRAKKRKERGWIAEDLQALDEAIEVSGHPQIVLGGPKRPLPALEPSRGNALLKPVGELSLRSPADLPSALMAATPPSFKNLGQSSKQDSLITNCGNYIEFVQPPGAERNMLEDKLGIMDQLTAKP